MASQRCVLCSAIDIVELIKCLGAYQKRRQLHHRNYQALTKSAADGCDLCDLLLGSLFRKDGKPGLDRVDSGTRAFTLRRTGTDQSTTSSSGVVEDVGAWHEELDGDRSSPPFILEVTAESTLSADFAVEYVVRYQRPFLPGSRAGSRSGSVVDAPKPQRLVLSSESNLGLGILNRPIAPYPSFGLYGSWLWECAYGPKHSQCQKSRLVELPERLIDVGTGGGSSLPKLALTGGMKGQYLTLSHRWGTHPTLKTESTNFQAHLNGIPFDKFPKMFRDAILVTKMLGFQYLWIDSLCIVQDDVADWENECSRMGDIYLNSVCTLAAPSATSSHGDLLSQRSSQELASCRLEAKQDQKSLGFVTLGPTPDDFKDRSGILSSRAWVLQEQLLSPRTLYFGPNGMYFQCTSHEYLESYHHPLPPERVTPWRTAEANDLPKTLMAMTYKDPIYWYAIARQYSFRNLTFGDDKLPALSGLANIVSSQWEDDGDGPFGEYWAGIWEKDVGRGLLWTTDNNWNPARLLHDADEQAPSWSWVSQNTPVEWRVLNDWKSDVDVIDCKMELAIAHKFGRVRSGTLELNGPVRSASLQRRGGKRGLYLSGIADAREVAEISLDGTTTTLLSATWPETDLSFACRALMLGNAESSLYGSRWYALLLVPIADGKYRRIGIANSLGSDAVHARSFTAEQSYSWFGSARHENIMIV